MYEYTCPTCRYVERGETSPVFCPQCKCPGKKFERSFIADPPDKHPDSVPSIENNAPAESAAPRYTQSSVDSPSPALLIADGLSAVNCSAEVGAFMIVSRAAANAGYPDFAEAMARIAADKAEEASKPVETLLKKYMK